MRAMGLRFKPLWNLRNHNKTTFNTFNAIFSSIASQITNNHKRKKLPIKSNQNFQNFDSPSASTGSEELDELIGGHVEESIQIDSSEAELLERSLLRHSGHRHIGLNVRLKRNHRERKRETLMAAEKDVKEKRN